MIDETNYLDVKCSPSRAVCEYIATGQSYIHKIEFCSPVSQCIFTRIAMKKKKIYTVLVSIRKLKNLDFFHDTGQNYRVGDS